MDYQYFSYYSNTQIQFLGEATKELSSSDTYMVPCDDRKPKTTVQVVDAQRLLLAVLGARSLRPKKNSLQWIKTPIYF